MILRILPSAIADLLDGARFYEKKEEGLGRYFFNSVTDNMQELMTTAGVHRKTLGLYRFICDRFPHAVYYTIENDVIIVWRILDCRRDPRRMAGSFAV